MSFDINNVLNISDVDQEIFRIFRLSRFKQMLCSGELVLANPLKFDDQYENFFLRQDVCTSDGERWSLAELQSSWYVQCWSTKRESDALWKIFGPERDGVRVSTTVRKLFSCIWNHKDCFSSLRYFVGKVSYSSTADIESFLSRVSFTDVAMGGQPRNFACLLCVKREEFSHEEEVRVVIHDVEHDLGRDGLYRQQFDFNSVLESICVDSRIDEDKFRRLKDEFESMGCTVPITQSELYKRRPGSIRL